MPSPKPDLSRPPKRGDRPRIVKNDSPLKRIPVVVLDDLVPRLATSVQMSPPAAVCMSSNHVAGNGSLEVIPDLDHFRFDMALRPSEM